MGQIRCCISEKILPACCSARKCEFASCHVVIVITAINYYVVHEISFFLQTVSRLDPKFIALHCQEVGGKNYECSMKHVEYFVRYVIFHPLFSYLNDEIYGDLLI